MVEKLLPQEWNDEGLRGPSRLAARVAAYAEGRLEFRPGDGWYHRHADDAEWVKDEGITVFNRTFHAVLGISEWLAEETDDAELREDVAYCRESHRAAFQVLQAARERLSVSDQTEASAEDDEDLAAADLI